MPLSIIIKKSLYYQKGRGYFEGGHMGGICTSVGRPWESDMCPRAQACPGMFGPSDPLGALARVHGGQVDAVGRAAVLALVQTLDLHVLGDAEPTHRL